MEPAGALCPKCINELSRLNDDKTGYYFCKTCDKWLSPREVNEG